jgi:hypothetical protein
MKFTGRNKLSSTKFLAQLYYKMIEMLVELETNQLNL